MPSKSEKVTEFRDLVDAAIGDQVREVEGSAFRPVDLPGYTKLARVAGRVFVSLDAHDARPAMFGRNEAAHMWGVGSKPFGLLGKTASMGVVSMEGQQKSLLRRISIESDLGVTVDTELELDTEEQLDAALKLASSQRMTGDDFWLLASLRHGEVQAVMPQLRDLAKQRRELDGDLAAIQESQRQAWRDAGQIIIF